MLWRDSAKRLVGTTFDNWKNSRVLCSDSVSQLRVFQVQSEGNAMRIADDMVIFSHLCYGTNALYGIGTVRISV